MPRRLTSIAYALPFATSILVFACLERPPGTPADQSGPAETLSIAPMVEAGAAAPREVSADEAERDNKRRPEDSSPAVAISPQPADGKDPLHGAFTLADATANLSGTGALIATITTNLGQIRCRLLDDKAPNTVANFVGLARGVRPFKSHVDQRWVTQPFYDHTSFHRVIKGFMIQGGDPQGTGVGEPGYVIADEIWPGAKHDHAGQLCMANRGPNTNGAQFFITDARVAHLDKGYTVFGECSPVSLVHTIASVPKGVADRPLTAVTIDRIEIARDGSANASKP